VVRVLICVIQSMRIETGQVWARRLAWLFADVVRIRGKLVDENLRHAFPEMSDRKRRQLARLKKLRQERDNAATGQALDRLRLACQGSENTMPFLLEAVRNYATLGEIMSVMKEVFGVYEESVEI